MMKWFVFTVFIGALLPGIRAASAQQWQSGPEQVDLVELYTSEGCSSCPPADAWLSSLKTQAGLFSRFVPVAFHVDYWDYIGWKDRFASASHTARQRTYVRQGMLSQVYTPGFVINSREWRRWFSGDRKWPDSGKQAAGILQADLSGSLSEGELVVTYSGEGAGTATIALLGLGLKTEVRAGENAGRTLQHDFVVLDSQSQSGAGPWRFTLSQRPEQGQSGLAIAVWVSEQGSLKVLQATGGLIE